MLMWHQLLEATPADTFTLSTFKVVMSVLHLKVVSSPKQIKKFFKNPLLQSTNNDHSLFVLSDTFNFAQPNYSC